MDNNLYNSQNQTASGSYGGAQDQPCAADVKNFTRCMDENQGNMGICGWYLDQLKACQQAARPY
jgi:coiled-coil-helix-coiled-coil-helix domain-containing protein 2